MKKKKLKKKIKKLRKELEMVMQDVAKSFDYQGSRINTLGDKYIKLREDLTHLEQDHNSDAVSEIMLQIDDIYEKLKVLKLRTETDYTQFKPLVDTSKSCENCKHWGAELRPCDRCYNQDEWEAKDE